MAKAKKAIPEGYRTLTPMLTLDDASAAIEWYKKALGAEEMFRSKGPDGKIMHAEIKVGDSRLMVHDAMMGFKGPKALGGAAAGLWVYVEDCDALFNRAVAAGGEVVMPMADQFWGDRCGNVRDPHGFVWAIASHKEDLTPQEIEQRQAEFFKQAADCAPRKE